MREVQSADTDLHLHLSAAGAWRDDGCAPPESGHLIGVTLVWTQARWHGAALGDCIGGLREARIRDASGGLHPGRIPWPVRLDGPLRAELTWRNGSTLQIEATSLHSQVDGGGAARFMTSLAC